MGTAINAALSGYDGTNTGTNAFTFSVSGTVTDVSFTDANGALLNGFDSGLDTADGEDIFLYTDTTNNNIVYGKTALNVVVFAAYLEETGSPVTGAKLWTVQYEAISNPDASNPDDAVNLADKLFVSVASASEFSFANVPSGQNLFAMFGNATAAIVVTGKNPANESTGVNINTGDTVNTSLGGGLTTIGTNNQMIDPPSAKNPGEGMYFTFVTGANADDTVPNLDQNEADEESNIDFTGLLGTTEASFTIAQLQPNKAATLKISAFTTVLASGDAYVDNLQNNTAINISSVVVRDSAGQLVTGLSIDLSGDTAVISGIKAGYVIEYQTDANHNRVLIENVGSATNNNLNASFDIGGFSLPKFEQATGEVGSMMVFEDDGPSVVLAAPTDTALVNTQDADTIGAATDSATQDFSTAFGVASSSYGADGAGTTVSSFALGVATQGGDSGLKSDGATIYLYVVSGKVIGSTSGTEAGILATNTIFDLAVSAIGSVTLQQFAEIDHALPGDSSNYADQEATLADTLITLTNTVTVTDGDGDTASDSKVLNIGANIKFDDDGPSVVLAAPIDTALVNTQDADTIGAATDSATQDFSTAFGVASSSYGADGAGTTVSSFALGVATQGGDSGLKSDGAVIRLYLVSGNVIGSTAATEADITAGNTIFDVTVSGTGSVTLQQFAEIDHALPGDSSNYADQEAALADTLITLTNTVTVTDGDGDTASDSKVLNIGANIKFDDDGPSVVLAAPIDTALVNTQDADTIGAATDSATQDFSTAFGVASSSYGADGAGTTASSFALGVATQGGDSGLKSDGATIYLYVVAGKVIGSTSGTEAGILATNTIFDLAVSASGSVTLQQFAEIDHALPGDSSNYADQEATLADTLITLTNTVTVTDGDGDTASDSKVLNIGANIKFDDDGPSVVLAAPIDTALVNTQDADTIGAATDSATQDFSTAFGVASSSYGADGAGTTVSSFALGVATQGGDSGLKSDGATIYLYVVAGKVIGSTSGTEAGILATNTIFDLAVSASGSVTLQQFAEIDHALPGDSSNYADQEATLADTLITLTNTVTVTDGDGDTASDSKVLNIGANIKFDDDGPSVVLAAPIDTALVNTQDADTIGAATDSATQDFSTAFGVASSSYGADGAGTTVSAFALGVATPGGASGLTSDGVSIKLYLVSGNVIGSTAATAGAITAGNTIFDLAVSATGSVTLRQFAEIDHAGPGVSSNFAAQQATMADTLITLTNTVTVTDGDGDTASDSEVLNIGANIKFDDDGPTVTAISDLTGANDGLPIAGTYNFSVGADDVDNASTDGIVLNSLTGTTGGGRAITDAVVSHFAEDATTVTYNFSFNYYPGPTSTTTQAATGTVVFNKTDGTFAFDMDQLIGGQTTFSTSSPLASFNYDTEGNNSPEIVVQQYSSDFFGVLSASSARPPSDSGDLMSGNDHAFTTGEIFTSESTAFVNVATNTLGVNSDTVQAGELLNFDFYRSNPVSNPTSTSPPQQPGAAIVGTDKAYADAIDITIDQITDGEDVAILLKLFDASTNTTTTRLLIANSATDYQSAGGGTKIVSIGEDDYNSAIYQIAGVQVLSSTEDLTGTGISLSTHDTVNLTSAGMNYADTADNDVFKIIKIDVITETTINSDVDLNFAGQLIDGDADYANFDFDVHLEIDGIANLIGTTNQPTAIA
ncbi:beta strand repeat-containing protein [Variovorax paradoxus]|uniref:beta strand repeat-containing protein n=1 Tax=Variovorax paradoxus TaxID=34073 RepID=UPI0004027786|nr:DUF5801 repeats-in-toxin domain-containing protein [Variovorax paradoxus]